MSQLQNQRGSLLDNDYDEDKEIFVNQLSGDEGTDKTVMVSFSNQPKANFFETVMTIVKCIIGSGIISLPYTVSVMGWLLSLLLFSLMGAANIYTVNILLKSKNLSKHSTYNSIAYHIYKSKYCILLLSFVNMFGNIGFIVAMLSILKSTFRKLIIELSDHNEDVANAFYTNQAFIAVVVSVFLVPTVLVKRVQSLKHLSVVGVGAIVLGIVSLCIIFIIEMCNRNWQNSFTLIAFPKQGLAALSVFPNILFALVFQSNFFSIYKGLKQSTDKRTLNAHAIGIGFSTFLYILLGFMGYCLAGKDDEYVNANFLLQVNPDDVNEVLYFGLYIGFLVCDLFCIPITFMVARNNLIAMIKILKLQRLHKRSEKSQQQKSAIQQIGSFMEGENRQEIKRKAKIRFYIYTLSLYAVYVLITVLVQSLAAVFNIVGAIASTAISFVIPFLFYSFLIQKKNKPKTIHYFICVTGIIIFVPLGILSVVSLYI